MKKIWIVLLFAMCNCVVYADVIREISVAELNETIIPAIENAENLLLNLEIEFEVSGQQKPLGSAKWEDSGFYANVKLLSEGKKKGKIKIDVFSEKLVGDVINEKSYAISYDGKKGKKLSHGKSSKGKMSKIKECTILSSRSDTIRSEMVAELYSNPFMLNYLVEGFDIPFSEYLKRLTEAKAASSFEGSINIKLAEFEGTECLFVQMEVEGIIRTTYWLDPARNYAPLAYENINWDNDGKEMVIPFIKVLEFEKVSEDIWFPVKTQAETNTGGAKIRKIFKVSKVRVNIKDLKDEDFDLDIPSDYKTIDKTVKK